MDDVQTVAWTSADQLKPPDNYPHYAGLFGAYEPNSYYDTPLVLRSDVESLAERVRELEGDVETLVVLKQHSDRDADRYRFLRERSVDSWSDGELHVSGKGRELLVGDELDHHVDTAMQQDGGGRPMEKPKDHVWVQCPVCPDSLSHAHFDWCGNCQKCGATLVEWSPSP